MLANSYRTVTTLSELTLTDTRKPCHCHYVCYDLYPRFPVPDFSVRAISISNAFVRVSKVLLVLVLDFPKPVLYTPLATVRCAALRLTLTAWGYRLPLCCRLFKASHIPQRLRNLQSLANSFIR